VAGAWAADGSALIQSGGSALVTARRRGQPPEPVRQKAFAAPPPKAMALQTRRIGRFGLCRNAR